MRSAVALAFLLMLAACSARPPEATGDALLDLWAALPQAMATVNAPETCDTPFGTWFEDFGVRGLACGTNQGVELASAARRAPVPIWTSGPHQLDEDGLRLDLTSEREFGRYNEAFVEWAVANAVPQTPGARLVAQPVYDRYVQRLARTYWLTLKDLEADGFPESLPAGSASDYAAYLNGGPMPGEPSYYGGVSVFTLFVDQSEPIAQRLQRPNDNIYEGIYEACTAYGFWVRRLDDGTADAFREGLSDLLEAMDPEWLAANPS